MKKKEEMTTKLRNKNFGLLDTNENVDIYNGRASFVSNNEVKVISNDNKEVILKADKIVINTGSVSRTLNIDGSDNKNVMTSEGILELKELPKKLLIIGAGYIGLEFASYFSNFGSEVSVFQFDDAFLVREDEDEAKIVKEILENKGVKFFFNTSVKKFENLGDSVKAIYVKDGQEFTEEFDKVLVAVGRKPNTDNLGLENTYQVANTHKVKVTYRQPARFPLLYLDDTKIRQVIMNFIDNAIYYSPDANTVKV